MSESGYIVGAARAEGRLFMVPGGGVSTPDRRRLGPVQWSDCLNWEEIELHRHLDCHHYNMCLTIAGVRRWPGFSCCRCDDFPGPFCLDAGLK